MKKMKINEDAVSPVIGVMLMIVVTVVIAAVVSGFAGGMSNSQEVATTAAIQCSIVKEDANNALMTLKHMSGDSINTQDMMIYVGYSTNGVPQQKRTKGVSTAGFTDSQGNLVSATVPYLTDVKVGDVGDNEVNYGQFIWNPGQVLTTGNSAAGFTALTGLNPADIDIGDIISVKLVDTRSQKTVFDKEVRVQ